MSKAVLISIRPEWCKLIANGKKTIEVRKTRPKLETPFKCYIYCTKGKPLLYCRPSQCIGNGLIIGEFVCDSIFPLSFYASDASFFDTEPSFPVPGTCLTDKEIADYLGNGKTIHGWHISDLMIYDEPKKLDEFMKKPCDFAASCGACVHAVRVDINGFAGVPVDCEFSVQRPPQSYCYVEELE